MEFQAAADLAGQPIFEPQSARENLDELGFPVEAVGEANSYTCPVGRGPGVAVLLLRKKELDALDKSALLKLTIQGGTGPALEIRHLTFRGATCILPGDRTDEQLLYRAEFADRRYRLQLRQQSLFSANLRDSEIPSNYFYSSMDSGSPWTWNSLCEYLWEQNSEMGDWLGFPPGYTAPANNPENLQWVGVSYFEMLCDVLERLRLILLYDPTRPGQLVAPYAFQVVIWGGSSVSFDEAIQAATPIDDAYNMAGYVGVPYRVTVQFPRQDEGFGRETRAVNPWYAVEAGSDVMLAAAGFNPAKLDQATRIVLQDDMTARFSSAGAVQNLSTLQARATERATDFYNQMNGTDWPPAKRTVYTGAVPNILPCAKCERVTWFDDGSGWKTETSNAAANTLRLKPTIPVQYGASTRLVKVETAGSFPNGGQRVYKCSVWKPTISAGSENATFTAVATPDLLYAASFRDGILIYKAFYLAIAVDGVWMIDNVATFVEDVVP